MTPPVHDAIVACARDSYSQLLSFVASRAGGDLASAEDALGEAFLAALQIWPVEGVPSRPEAWLLTAARRRLIDLQRREATRTRSTEMLIQAMDLVSAHQPYWVARGHLLQRTGNSNASRKAYQRAIGLTEDPAVRSFLLNEMASEDG